MLSGDRQHAVRKMTPLVVQWMTKNSIPIPNVDMDLHDLFESEDHKKRVTVHQTLYVNYELMSLDNREGVRVQCGELVEYFTVKSEGK